MTDTTTLEAAPTRRSGSLTAMKLAELQGLASSMGITGTAKMRKGDLVDMAWGHLVDEFAWFNSQLSDAQMLALYEES